MGKARDLAKLGGAVNSSGEVPTAGIANTAVTAAKLHTTAVTDKLGYTPVNSQNPSVTGRTAQNGNLFTGTVFTGQHGNITKTFNIAKIASHYWGSGGVIVEVFRQYYAGFGYAKYRVDGHGATMYSPGFSITQILSSGSTSPLSLSSIIIVNPSSGADGWGYVNLRITESPYYQSVVRVTSSIEMLPEGSASTINSIVMYPNLTGA
jgi:hypothetical protein